MSCRACDSGNMRNEFSVDECIIDKCLDCGFAQVRDVPDDEVLDKIYSAEYFDKGKYIDDYADRMEYLRRRSLVDSAVEKKGAKLLDYGCALGAFVEKCNDSYLSFGTDGAGEALMMCRDRHPDLAHRFLDICTLDESYQGKFQGVTMWDVIEHLANPREHLDQIMRLLAPDGVLILSTPNYSSIWSKILKSRWAFMTPPEHLGFFSARSMRKFLTTNGFAIDQIYSKGKFTNFGFLLYKLNRKARLKFLGCIVELLKGSFVGRLPIYVPGGDILYVVARRISSPNPQDSFPAKGN